MDELEIRLTDEAIAAGRDRIAWAMLVVSGEESPRAVWAESADVWRERAEGVFEAAVRAAFEALPEPEKP